MLKRAVLAFRSGDKQVARDLLAEASEHNPENELVWLWRASAARTRSEACAAVERVLDLNPDNEKALKWIEKLRPGQAAPPQQEAPEATVESRNGSLNGAGAHVEAEVVEVQEEQVAEDQAETVEQADETVEEQAATEQAYESVVEDVDQEEQEHEEAEQNAAAEEESDSYFEREERSVLTEETEETEEATSEPEGAVPSDAEARLAALEAYLSRGAREEDDPEPERQAPHVEGYGWGTPEENHEAPASDESAGDLWNRLTQSAENEDEQEDDDDGRDPLIGLLDPGERADLEARNVGYRDDIDGEVETGVAGEQEYQERLSDLRESQPQDSEDVWASLGMAGMEGSGPVARETAEPLKAKAAGMGFAEMGISARAAEEVHDAPPANEEGETQVEGCFICEKLAKEQDGMCSSCRSIVDLRLHEIAPRHEGADRGTLTAALDRVRAKIEKKATADLCVKAALICLNLRQSNQALGYLREACRLRPHDRELLGYYDQIESRPLILAVDDSKTVQKMISTVLEKESYRVSAAEDGLSAIAKLDEEMPQLILLDITMPRMDGYQVCKVITGNAATKHIPVIMLSGKDGFFDKVRGKMVGASNYITKPFDPNDLTKTIAKFIKKKQQ